MNITAPSTKGVKLAVGAMLAAFAFLALGLAMNAGQAKASTVGAPVNPEFNYVGLNVGTTIAGEVNELVLTPPAEAIGLNGEYTDTNGNFTVPQTGGLDFPPVAVDLGPVQIDGEIGLTKAATGNYNESTGAMNVDLSLALTLGVDDLEALGDELGFPLGTGSLRCQFAPLEIPLSTGNGWPAPGKAYDDKANLEEGALAGAWRYTPTATTIEGDATVCGMIGGFLQPVGGIWLANTADSLGAMPAATGPKPTPLTCEELGLVGTYPDCKEPEVACPAGFTGVEPNCVPVDKATPAKITKIKVGGAKIKAGKKGKIKITVTNKGGSAFKGKIKIKSSSKAVKAPKAVTIKVAAGKSATKTITLKTTKKAKGKVTITAKVGGKTGKAKVKIKK